ncbi:unnamed protein product [Ascophyllum nodosum]
MATDIKSMVLFLFCAFLTTADAFAGAYTSTPSRGRSFSRTTGAEAVGKGKVELSNTAAMSLGDFRGGSDRSPKIEGRAIPQRALEGYQRSLEKRPIITKGISSGIIAGTANFMQQSLSDAAFSMPDWTAFTMIGTFYLGPFLHLWFSFLDSLVQSKAVRTRVKSKLGRVVVQVGLDSTIGAATLNTGVFAINTVLVAAFTGRVSSLPDLWSAVRHRVSSNFWPMMTQNLKLWPWVSFVNFRFVPAKFRVLLTNLVAVFWNYLMSQWCR